jgi:hypothetical protein
VVIGGGAIAEERQSTIAVLVMVKIKQKTIKQLNNMRKGILDILMVEAIGLH